MLQALTEDGVGELLFERARLLGELRDRYRQAGGTTKKLQETVEDLTESYRAT